MKIPSFNIHGNLPSGIYELTWEEFKRKFAYNYQRKQLLPYLEKLINDLKSISCETIYICGSYVTSKLRPNDFDICWDINNVDLGEAYIKIPELDECTPPRTSQQEKYKSDIFPANVIEHSSNVQFLTFFQIDKEGNPRGIIKINLK